MSKILIGIAKNVRFAIADTTKLVEEARKYSVYDDMLLTSEYALMNIVSLMSTNIKTHKGKITVVLKADGVLGTAKVRAKTDGKIVANATITEEQVKKLNSAKSLEEFSELYAIGKGEILVETDLGLKSPYLTRLEIAEKESIEGVFEDYYKSSEQLGTIIKTSLKFDDNNYVTNSGGMIIQMLPGASEEAFSLLESKVKMLHSVAEMLSHDFSLEKIASLLFEDVREGKSGNLEEYKILEVRELKFECECSKLSFAKLVLKTTTKEDIHKLLEENGYIETVCGFCNSVYRLKETDLKDE